MIDPEAMRMVDAMRFDSHKAMIKQAMSELNTLAVTLLRFEGDRTKRLPRSGKVTSKMEEISGLLSEAKIALHEIDRLIEKGHTL